MKSLLLSASLTLFAPVAFAAGTDTGVEAGFSSITETLQTLMNGAGGYLILILSVIIGVIVYAFTQRWGAVLSSVVVAFLLGYGVDMVSSMGGISASVDILSQIHPIHPDATLAGGSDPTGVVSLVDPLEI